MSVRSYWKEGLLATAVVICFEVFLRRFWFLNKWILVFPNVFIFALHVLHEFRISRLFGVSCTYSVYFKCSNYRPHSNYRLSLIIASSKLSNVIIAPTLNMAPGRKGMELCEDVIKRSFETCSVCASWWPWWLRYPSRQGTGHFVRFKKSSPFHSCNGYWGRSFPQAMKACVVTSDGFFSKWK